MLGKLPVPGRPTNWNRVGQVLTVFGHLWVGVVWTFFSRLSFLFFFFPLSRID